jgi:NADH-quinone oxidoreductase subunit E
MMSACAQCGTPGEATLAGLRIAHERGMTAPRPGEAGATASGPDDERIAKESVRDEPAPAPSADVPPTNGKAT